MKSSVCRWDDIATLPDLQRLIVAMARANPTWDEEHLADELRLEQPSG
jgi:hypothetical protein